MKRLEKAGVTSAKIEGRMKRPEYVEAVTGQCKAALNGEKTDIGLLKTVFSRSGFTKGYFDESFSEMSGIRRKEDAEGSEEALKEIRQLYRQPLKRYKIDITIVAKKNTPLYCKAVCGDIISEVYGEIPQKAINRNINEKEISERICKFGGTVFEAASIKCSADKGIAIPAAVLNGLRRSLAEQLEDKIEEKTKKL